jgi:branched-chain amino acid transport system permease protein
VRKRAAALLVALVGAVVVILGGTATPALAADTPINGILVNAGQPVAGVVITVSNDSGFSETATSGTDGTWKVIAPGGCSYTVELDTAT